MKILQTYWNAKNENPLLNSGGFLCPEVHWMAWALSCLQLREFYPEVELHTNKEGKYIFERLGIPYTRIHTTLDSDFMNNLESEMWAYAKIHTYSIQREPFLHVDGDVFIWKPFKSELLNAPLIAQCYEDNMQMYHNSIQVLRNTKGAFIPSWLDGYITNPKAYNAGILGANDINFIELYTNLAFDYYNKNKHILKELINSDRNVNILPEQLLFYSLSESTRTKVTLQTLKPIKAQNDFAVLTNVLNIAEGKEFVHTLSRTKQLGYINNFISYTLRKNFPKTWDTIIDFFRANNSLSPFMEKFINNKYKVGDIIVPSKLTVEAKVDEIDNILLENKQWLDSKKTQMILSEIQRKVENGNDFNRTSFICRNLKIKPLMYDRETSFFESDKFENLYVCVVPYLRIYRSLYNWKNSYIYLNPERFTDNNRWLNYEIYFLDPYFYSFHRIDVSDILIQLLEKIRCNAYKVNEIVKLFTGEFNSEHTKEISIYNLLQIWYSYGLIYFSEDKKDFIPQQPSKVYLEHQNNLRTQISSDLRFIFKHYKISRYSDE